LGDIVLVAVVAVAVVAVVLLVVSSRLNRHNPELEDYPGKPKGADDVWVFEGGPGSGYMTDADLYD
jgi:hypothetical protein